MTIKTCSHKSIQPWSLIHGLSEYKKDCYKTAWLLIKLVIELNQVCV